MDDYREQNSGSKYYNGVKLQDEDFDYLELAMQVALEKIKVKNKETYTPNKFKKQVVLNLTGDFIRIIIKKLKKKYNTSSPSELAESLNITVIIQRLGNVLQMYKYINRNKVIFINSVLSEIERRFVLTHEIGHAVLHPKSSCYFINEHNYISKI